MQISTRVAACRVSSNAPCWYWSVENPTWRKTKWWESMQLENDKFQRNCLSGWWPNSSYLKCVASRGNLLLTEYWSEGNLRANKAVVCSTRTLSSFNLLSFFIFTEKIEGSRKGSRRGPEWGVQNGGPGFVYTLLKIMVGGRQFFGFLFLTVMCNHLLLL